MLFAWELGAESDGSVDQVARVLHLAHLMVWLGAGVAAGSFVTTWVKHPVRSLGLVPLGACGFAVALGLVSLYADAGEALCVVLGVAFSLINVPLAATYQAGLPADARGNGMAARNFCDYAVTTLLAGILLVLIKFASLSASGQFWLLTVLAGLMAVITVRLLYCQMFEMVLETLLLPMYRVTATGPGVAEFPREGPVLVVANHSAWLDPAWLGKMLPRRFVPMMTSRFFDLPVIHWLVKNVAGAIRVEESRFRRDVPELAEAIQTLDEGKVLMLFPEGGLRRREETPLKFFGQGVWHILHERPTTPVVVCWIEGGWGSFFSMYKGPPTKNKPIDFRRPIRIGFATPEIIAPDILADQRRTRSYLMEKCLHAREYLGLPALSVKRDERDEEVVRE